VVDLVGFIKTIKQHTKGHMSKQMWWKWRFSHNNHLQQSNATITKMSTKVAVFHPIKK